MSTARDLIRRSLTLIGVIAEGETPSATQLQDGLSVMNEMLESWSAENLIIYSKVQETFTLPSGNAAPTMRPTTGTFTTTRPVEVEKANAKSGSTELPIDIITFDQWAAISDKSTTGTIPQKLYVDYSSPLATLNFWPVPSANVDVVLYSRKALTSMTENTTIAFPPGYSRAIRYNLAIELCPEYGKSATAEVVRIADESKGNIKRLNSKPVLLSTDPALVKRGGFNIIKGS